MALLDFVHREITTKVVYFGAPNAGVSTNVERLADMIPSAARSELHRFGPAGASDPSVAFEYVSPDLTVRGFPLRVQVYGVPGGLHHGRLRRQVLEDTDAVIFVADARADKEQSNVDSMLDLEQILRDQDMELAGMPMVVQVNHTDATHARPVKTVVVDINPYGFPVHSAIARTGEGVQNTHTALLETVVARLGQSLSGQPAQIDLAARRVHNRPEIAERVHKHLDAFRTETARAARAADPKVRFAGLPLSDSFRVPYQPESLRGTRAVALLGSRMDGLDLVLDLVHEPINGGEPKRIRIHLENRPVASNSSDRLPEFATSPLENTDVTANLPDSVDIVPPVQDWPPLMYGLVGVVCGLMIGFLLGVLLLV